MEVHFAVGSHTAPKGSSFAATRNKRKRTRMMPPAQQHGKFQWVMVEYPFNSTFAELWGLGKLGEYEFSDVGFQESRHPVAWQGIQ